ncbi:MAG: pilus assembly protein N-terminal domain-containing protein [Minicystis sp.]
MSSYKRLLTALAFALPLAAAAPALAQKKGGSGSPLKADAPVQQEIGIAVGETRTIPAGDVKQYSEGSPGIADVRLTPDGGKFVIVGQRSGSTSLLMIKNDGTQVNWVINVFSRSPELVERELSQLLEGYPGLRIRRVGARLFIEGGVANEAEQKRTTQIAALYPGQVESLVTVGTGAIDRKLNIRVDFFFVQYDKSSDWQLGISGLGKFGGTQVVQSRVDFNFLKSNPLTTATASIVNQPLPGLDLASTRGWVKVLKQATVITTNGNEARFDSGGEQNFKVSTGLTSTIMPISFGTNVTILPRYDPATRNLEVKVQADIADLAPPGQGTDIPSRNISKLSTLVFLKLGQSLVLSGIRTKNERRSVDGLIGLSWIPVLGVLFGSMHNVSQDVEGAVFIIPSVVESVPRGQFDIVKEALEQYDDYSGGIRDVKTYQKTPPEEGAEKK